ncbi:MAG: L,D-transpeptidase family protein [Gammaproteobacteria bacterium]
MTRIEISISDQTLKLFQAEQPLRTYAVSTAANGSGEQNGSFCTPRGRHHIRLKIGQGCAPNTIFVGRRPTGEQYTPALHAAHPERDWILTRILWLSGDEPGFNRGGNVDTLRRFIYIHGTPDSTSMGVPGSRGCIRMRNADLMELFDLVEAGTPVFISES